MRDMVKTVFPEGVARREAEKTKAAATKHFQALVFSSVQRVQPPLLTVGARTVETAKSYWPNGNFQTTLLTMPFKPRVCYPNIS